MPDGFGAAPTGSVFQYLKGRVEKREAVWNTFLWLVHQSTGFCVSGTFPAEDPWTAPGGQEYAFWFWTVNGKPAHPDATDPSLQLPPPGVECVGRATQWYYKTGPSGGPKTLFLWAFNMKTGSFANESPVYAPPEAAGQSSVLTAEQDWTITAKDSIGSGNQTQPFHHWWKTGSQPQAPYQTTLYVPKDTTGSAIAFYGEVEGGAVLTPGGGGGVSTKPIKDALAEVKGTGLEFENLFDMSIYVRRLSDRLDRLEEEIKRGRSFISGPERPTVGGTTRRSGG